MGAHLSRSKRMHSTHADKIDSPVLPESATEERESGVDMTGIHKRAPRSRGEDTRPVTLVVYGWSSVEPGTLAWPFPTLQAALDAARTMKNATQWAVVSGTQRFVDVDDARANGRVLVETLPGDLLRLG